MPRQVAKDIDITSKDSRKDVEVRSAPYWYAIEQRLHLGYRKSRKGGVWLVRQYIDNGQYRRGKPFAVADDNLPANGDSVLSFNQARTRALKDHAKELTPAGPLTVRQACAAYIEFLRAEKKTADDAEQRLARHVLPSIGDTAV